MKLIKLVIFSLLLFANYAKAQWTQQTIPNATASMKCAYFKNTNEGFVAGAERIYKTTNGGTAWDTCSYGIYWAYLNGCIVEGIHFVSATEGIAAGWNFWDNCEIVFKTHDGGNTWTDIRWGDANAAFGTYLYDMHFANTTTGFCVGDLGHIIKSSDGGDNWAYLNSGTTKGLKGVYFTSTTNGYAVGDEVILKTTNGGTSWTSQSYTGVYFTDVTFTNATTGYAITSNTTYKTIDGGTTWNIINSNVGGEDLTVVNNDTIFLASYAGVYKSNNAGVQFLLQPSIIPNNNFYGIYFYNSTLGFAMNYNGQVFKTSASGEVVQQNDAGISSINQLPFGSCQGIQPVDVRIKNYGQANLTQATINWKVKGIAQPPYVWNGNLPFDSVSAPFAIGSYNFPGGNSDLVVYTTQANAQSDFIHYNDTTSTIYSFPRLRGTYTIGGTNPDFATVDAAIDVLNNYGTCGNVEFKIRNGTYQPTLNWNISNFYKNSVSDSVVFSSESGDSTQVILQGFNSNIAISRASKITFSKLTFQNTGSGTMLQLTDSTANIALLNCVFLAPASGGSIAHSGKACINFSVKNCRFQGGGININTTNGTQINDGISITKCVFDSITDTGISITFAKNILIQDNIINGAFSSQVSGITLTTCNFGFLIDRNKIFTNDSYNLLYLNGCQDTMGTEGVVTNNFFGGNIGTTSFASCIHIFNCIKIKFIYNTVNCSNDYAVRIYQNDTLKWPEHTFINNIISNRRNSVVFGWSMPSNISDFYLSKVFKEIGHNAYYNFPGGAANYPYQFFAGGDFDDWKGYYPSDSTSIFADPQFATYSDYHFIPNKTNIYFNNMGKPVAGITKDIENTNRNASTPDVGCDEFNLYNVDAGVKSFLSSTRICSGVNAVEISVGNFGLNNITSGTINWTVNGTAQTPYTWSGNISSGNSSALVAIGSYNFVNGNTYSIQAWMSNANLNADVNHVNDTATITVTAKGLSGTYTIGGTSPSYTTFVAAAADLILNGVCGPVTFNVRNGFYQDSLPLTPVAGASLINTITFQSETGDSTAVTLWNVGRKVVRLDTVGYLIFNQMTIVDSTLGSVQAAFYCRGTPHHITIKNCIIRSNSGGFSIRNEGRVITDFTFDNNVFSGGNSAISITFGGLGFYLCKNISITNNRFQNKNATIISIARGANVLIDKNYFYSYLYFNPSGIAAIDLNGGVTSKVTVTNNVLNLRNYNQAIGYSGNGQPADKNLFANNMVSILGPSAGSCFWMQSNKNVRVVYNSAIADSGNASAAVFNAPGAGSEIFNNSFYNKGSGTAAYFSGIECESNNNNFFASASLPVKTFTNSYTLSAWQSFSGLDANSFSGDPFYVSQNNLHSTGSYDLNGNGIAIAGVTKDYDGDLRSATPDIGADEFPLALQVNDAGVKEVENPDTLCAGVHPVKVRIRNYGSAALTAATINWKVNGVLQTPYSWTGTLSSLAISNYIIIGNYTFGSLDTFDIVAWTSNPNGVSDAAAVNDTTTLPGILTRMSGVYTIGGTNPDFATFVIALQKIKSIGICGPVTFNLRNGTHQGPSNNINAFVGLSATNTWTIQSESGDSNAVIIDNNNLTATLLFNTFDYTTIKNVTVNTWASYDAIQFTNGSEYNKVTGCILNGRLTLNNNCHYNVLENNLVNSDIYLNGQSGLYCIGNIVRSNIIHNTSGIHFYYQDSIVIDRNIIENITGMTPGNTFGIKTLGNNSRHWVTKNKITGNFSRMFDISADGPVNDTAIIANNILIAGDNAGVGVHLQGGYVKFVYNTIYIPSTSGAAPLQNVSMPFDDGLVITNNQFIAYNYSYACYWGQLTWTTNTLSDFNNYYTNGSTSIQIGLSSYYPTVDSFSIANPGYDLNSTGVDPQFQSPNFLFPTNPLALNTGTLVYGVIDDYNGLLRDPLSPTMGALETPPVILDDSINKDVSIKLLNTSFSLGNNTVSVQINNLKPFFVDTVFHNFIGTVDTLYLSYSVNGSAPVNQAWIGSLAMNDSLTFNFSTPYNVPKGRLYTVFVQVTLPSSYNTLALQNDTVTNEIGLPMVGIYTVGGSNPDFANLDEANYNVYYIHTSGDVTFNIRNGLDSIYAINDYYDPYFLTYQSETGNANDVQIIFSNANDSYRINFKNVTIYPKTNTDYLYNYKGAELIGGQFSFDSCIIRGLNNTLLRNGLTFVHCDSVSVTNCQFVDLENGVNFSDYNWFGSNYFSGKCFVQNNTFDSVHTCVRVLGWMTDSVYISRNVMNEPYTGIDYNPDGFSAPANISFNKINNATSMSLQTGNFSGGYINSLHCYNNMFSSRVTIANQNNHPVNFNYNSVYGFLEVNDCADFHAHNNSVYSYTNTPALLFDQGTMPSTVYDCDNNNYYSPGATALAFINIVGGGNGAATTITDLTTLTGTEINSVSANPFYTSAFDLHATSPILNNAGTPLTNITTDIDDELRNVTSPDIGCDEFTVVDSLVWPGDCNYDGIANNYDLLSIGLYFNQTGTTRAGASNTWVGQASADWGALQYCGYDKKHADSNGDGVVNWSDTTAIKLNWGQTHAFRPSQLPYTNVFPDLHFVSTTSSYKPGDTVDVEIWAGDFGNQVPALYGISFDVAFPSSMVQAGSMTLTYTPSWIGIENVNAVTAANISATAAGSIVRITGTDTSGYGMIAKLHFIVEPTLTTVSDYVLGFSNYLALTANGNLVQFNTVSDTLTIDPTLSMEENASLHFFNLYPNPATDETTISYALQSSSQIQIELYNSIGENIAVLKNEKQQAGNHHLGLKNLTGLSKGIYFIKLIVDGKVYLKKLLVE